MKKKKAPAKPKAAPKPRKGRIVTVTEVSSIFGVTELTVRRWIDQGCPASKSGRVWRVNTADLFGFVRAIDSGRSKGSDIEERLAAAKLTQAEMAVAEAEGTVIEIAKVEHAMAEVMTIARTQLLAIGSTVSGECATAETPAECRAIVDGAIRRVCEDIASGLQVITTR